MNRTLSSLLLVSALLTFSLVKAQVQQIIYSEPQKEDSRRTNFEIIGKITDNFLVFSNNNSNSALSIFDADMKLLQRVPLYYLPERYINVDFGAYSSYFYMIYEYQKKNIVHCAAVKVDGQGQKMGEPFDLDTTQIGFANNNKIYTT